MILLERSSIALMGVLLRQSQGLLGNQASNFSMLAVWFSVSIWYLNGDGDVCMSSHVRSELAVGLVCKVSMSEKELSDGLAFEGPTVT